MEETARGKIARDLDSAQLAVSNLVHYSNTVGQKNSLLPEKGREPEEPKEKIDYRNFDIYSRNSLPLLDKNLEKQGFSKGAIKIARQAWRPATRKVYTSYIKQWLLFSEFKGFDPSDPEAGVVAEFLKLLAKEDNSYSTVNIARCALSAVVDRGPYNTIGSNRYICMLVKGVGNVKPPKPRYSTTWNVNDVLVLLKSWGPNNVLKLKKLTLKLTMLLSLCTAQRGQTIWRISVSGLKFDQDGVLCHMKHMLKHNKVGEPLSVIPIMKYDDALLCPVECLRMYLRRKRKLRGDVDQLLITTIKPFRAAGRNSVSNWVKRVLSEAGIDTGKYKSHSTRAAAASKVTKQGVNVNALMKVACWKSAKTFGRYYNKPIDNPNEMVMNSVLNA